jgi:hypothetical protein
MGIQQVCTGKWLKQPDPAVAQSAKSFNQAGVVKQSGLDKG